MPLQTKVYDSAMRSRLEPSAEQQCLAKEFQRRQRANGYLIVYSTEKSKAEIVSMSPAALKQHGIHQTRFSAADRDFFNKHNDVFSMMAERAWLRQGLQKASEEAAKVFEEVLRVFPGARFVERIQGKFVDESARKSLEESQ